MRVRVAAALAALCALPALSGTAHAAAMPGCAQGAKPGGEWRSYGRDLANSRTQFNEKVISGGDAPGLTQAWTFSTVANGGAGDITGTPVVADGCMYVATTRGWLFAVNADTGKLVWKAQVPLGGSVNSSVGIADRVVSEAAASPLAVPRPATTRAKAKRKAKRKSCSRLKSRKARRRCVASRRRAAARARARARARKRAAAKKRGKVRRNSARAASARVTAGTVYIAVTRTQKADGCGAGDACIGPYIAAYDQATGKLVWATQSLDSQPGADVYGSPVIFDDTILLGISGGSAELGDEADRYAFQGSMMFVDASTGKTVKKTYTIHPPKKPDDEFAGAGVWSTPAIDAEDKVAFAGTANPFKPQAEHKYANSVVKYDVDRRSKTFGEIVGHYKGQIDEYVPGFSNLPCYDFPNNNPPYYPQGVGSCGDIDLDFGSSPNLFRDKSGRKMVGAGQKSGVYHVFDAKTMKPAWTQVVGPPGALGGIVGSTAHDGSNVFGPITIPGYLWSVDATRDGAHRWVGPIVDGAHWGPPVSAANNLVYTVDFNGFLDVFDARNGALIARKPLALGGGSAQSISWGGVSIARNTIYAAVGVLGLADGFVVAFKPGTPAENAADLMDTPGGLAGNGNGGGGGGGGGGQPDTPVGPSVLAGPGAASVGYATPVMVTRKGGPLNFVNFDVVQHDVVAKENGPDGKPWFKSKLIGLAETAPVEGLERVEAGRTYPFYCSLHPGMQGSLQVNG